MGPGCCVMSEPGVLHGIMELRKLVLNASKNSRLHYHLSLHEINYANDIRAQAEIGGVGIGDTLSGLSRDVFERPLVQSLMKEDIEDVDMQEEIGDASAVMWLDPVVALRMLDGIIDQYEALGDLFTKVDWRNRET